MIEYTGNVHLHTRYSDGTMWHSEVAREALAAGLDFLIFTDHNVWVDGIEGYYRHGRRRLLALAGEEVHDVRRSPQANHFLAYGADRELATFASDPQTLIDATNEAGGLGFLAHPFDPASKAVGESDLGWKDWDISGYTGLEIWNYMSNFKSHLTSLPRVILAAFAPTRVIEGPHLATLSKWDQLLTEGRRVLAVGSSDAHGMRYHLGPLSKVIFPYRFLFRAINLHVLISGELSGQFESDKEAILSAIGQGRAWVGYDRLENSHGFRFLAHGRRAEHMGASLSLDEVDRLEIITRTNCNIRLIRNGSLVGLSEGASSLSHRPSEPGAYRVECSRRFKGKERGWIYSNPIFIE